MPGIYIHIPYCHKACHYCNFHFSTNLRYIERTIGAILREAEFFAAEFSDLTFNTLYFGGGTPSLLDTTLLKSLLNTLNASYRLRLEECTLEANPEDIHPEKLLAWRSMGIDRLSIGIQSFEDQFLQKFNRNHTADQALKCIDEAKRAGFEHFNVDLIFGFPGQRLDQWVDDLKKAADIHPEHLSVYALTREEGTAYDYMVKTKKIEDVEDSVLSDMFYIAHDTLTSAGYNHYEISNYALPGHEARHNSSYWSGDIYLGFGPSAHSFLGSLRRWNLSDNALYEKKIFSGQRWYEEESMTDTMRFNELIITGIRTSKGISLTRCLQILGENTFKLWWTRVDRLIQKGVLKHSGDHLILENSYRFVSDKYAVDLML